MNLLRLSLLLSFTCISVNASAKEVTFGDAAPAMVPLLLSDGTQLDLETIGDKVVVLYFYEQDCPGCRKLVPKRNTWLDKYADQPVRFIAIGAGDPAMSVKSYMDQTDFRLVATADPMSIIERSWGLSISLRNIYQTRVIANGRLRGYDVDDDSFASVMKGAKWKYPREDYDAALVPVLDKFEWGDLEGGVKLLKQARRSSKQPIAKSAEQFYKVLADESKSSVEQAVEQIEKNPVETYDQLSRVVTIMTGDPLAKQAQEHLKTLKSNAEVKDEIAARKLFAQLTAGIAQGAPGQERRVGSIAESIVKKYPKTPTAKRVERIIQAWK